MNEFLFLFFFYIWQLFCVRTIRRVKIDEKKKVLRFVVVFDIFVCKNDDEGDSIDWDWENHDSILMNEFLLFLYSLFFLPSRPCVCVCVRLSKRCSSHLTIKAFRRPRLAREENKFRKKTCLSIFDLSPFLLRKNLKFSHSIKITHISTFSRRLLAVSFSLFFLLLLFY